MGSTLTYLGAPICESGTVLFHWNGETWERVPTDFDGIPHFGAWTSSRVIIRGYYSRFDVDPLAPEFVAPGQNNIALPTYRQRLWEDYSPHIAEFVSFPTGDAFGASMVELRDPRRRTAAVLRWRGGNTEPTIDLLEGELDGGLGEAGSSNHAHLEVASAEEAYLLLRSGPLQERQFRLVRFDGQSWETIRSGDLQWTGMVRAADGSLWAGVGNRTLSRWRAKTLNEPATGWIDTDMGNELAGVGIPIGQGGVLVSAVDRRLAGDSYQRGTVIFRVEADTFEADDPRLLSFCGQVIHPEETRVVCEQAVEDLRPLLRLKQLKELVLAAGPDLSPLAQAPGLELLDLRGKVDDLSSVVKLTKLVDLRLSEPVKDLRPLRELSSLRSLQVSITRDQVGDIASLTQLQVLALDDQRAHFARWGFKSGSPSENAYDLAGLAALKEIRKLYLNVEVASWDWITKLPTLEYVLMGVPYEVRQQLQKRLPNTMVETDYENFR